VVAAGVGSDSTPSLGISICRGSGPRKGKKTKNNNNNNKKIKKKNVFS